MRQGIFEVNEPAQLESLTHLKDTVLEPGNSFPKHLTLSRAMWVSSLHLPKSRLCVWYTALKPEGVEDTAALSMVRAPGGPLQCGWNQAQKERGQTIASSLPITTFECRIAKAQGL